MIVACLALGLVIAPFAPAAQAQSGNITLTLDRGQGANYAIGEAITINFTLPQPGFVRLVSITSVGAREIAAGPTPGTTGQIRSTVGQPAERHTLRMELLVNNQLVATGETFFNATTGNPNANQVGCNASVNGQLANTTDQDRWSFAGVSGQRVSATLNSTVPVQLTLQALKSAGDALDQPRARGGGLEARDLVSDVALKGGQIVRELDELRADGHRDGRDDAERQQDDHDDGCDARDAMPAQKQHRRSQNETQQNGQRKRYENFAADVERSNGQQKQAGGGDRRGGRCCRARTRRGRRQRRRVWQSPHLVHPRLVDGNRSATPSFPTSPARPASPPPLTRPGRGPCVQSRRAGPQA